MIINEHKIDLSNGEYDWCKEKVTLEEYNLKKYLSISFWKNPIIIFISFKLGEKLTEYYSIASTKLFSLDLLVKLIIVFIITEFVTEIENKIKEFKGRKKHLVK